MTIPSSRRPSGSWKNYKDARVAPVSLRLLDQAAEMPLYTLQTVDRAGISQADLAAGDAAQRSMLCFTCAFAFVKSSTNATDELVRHLTHTNAQIRAAATAALREDPHRGPHLAQYLTPLLDDGDPAVRQQATMTLRSLDPTPAPKVELSPKRLAEFEKVSLELQRRIERQAARRKRRF
jgi:hypothetical protein